MEFLPLAFLTIVELLAARFAFLVWFRPKEYFEHIVAMRRHASEAFPVVLRIRTVTAITHRPGMDLWWARTVSLFVVLTAGVALVGTLLQALPR